MTAIYTAVPLLKGIAGCVEDVVTYTHWRCINNTDIIPERG
jgi:hypothetical protein